VTEHVTQISLSGARPAKSLFAAQARMKFFVATSLI
jgi:hypothetical protein